MLAQFRQLGTRVPLMKYHCELYISTFICISILESKIIHAATVFHRLTRLMLCSDFYNEETKKTVAASNSITTVIFRQLINI